LRVYTTRLLGQNHQARAAWRRQHLVKTISAGPAREDAEVLCVKGDRLDMGTMEPPACRRCGLAPLRKLRARSALSDEEMVPCSARA